MHASRLVPEILFEDQNVLVISKPAGLLSQGETTGEPNLVDWARAHVGRSYVGLVHRLDRNTSGAMVLAKRTKAADRLTRALQAGQLTRNYLGWVNGTMSTPVRWEHRLYKDERTNQVRVVPPSDPRGKNAILTAIPKEHSSWHGDPVTLVEFTLETGRGHQIRVQAAHEGHPLVGDRKYETKASGPHSREFGRPALHSYRIAFPHPITGQQLEFTAPFPTDFLAILSRAR